MTVRAVAQVRASDDTGPGALAAAGEACQPADRAYLSGGVADRVLAACLRWLSDYKHPRTLDRGPAGEPAPAFEHPALLAAGAGTAGDPVAVAPSVSRLLWPGRLPAGSASVLPGRSTLVRAAGEDR
jgi:hypothetical protein